MSLSYHICDMLTSKRNIACRGKESCAMHSEHVLHGCSAASHSAEHCKRQHNLLRVQPELTCLLHCAVLPLCTSLFLRHPSQPTTNRINNHLQDRACSAPKLRSLLSFAAQFHWLQRCDIEQLHLLLKHHSINDISLQISAPAN